MTHTANPQVWAIAQRFRRYRSLSDVERTTPNDLHEDDYVFWTGGFGEHAPTHFVLRDSMNDLEVATLHPSRIFLTAPARLKGLFVAPHLTAMLGQHQQTPVTFGEQGATYSFSMDADALTTRFEYKRPGQPSITQTLTYKEQLFFEEDVAPGVCYRLIEQLRLVGDPYRSKLLIAVASSEVTQERKLELLDAAMSHLMPGDVCPEAKIPASVQLEPEEIAPLFQFNLDESSTLTTAVPASPLVSRLRIPVLRVRVDERDVGARCGALSSTEVLR
jgi:hypothetical protein